MDVAVSEYTGSHRDLAWSFREAEDSEQLLEAYQETAPLRQGWQQRTAVHQLFYLAVHWALFGAAYRGATLAAAKSTADQSTDSTDTQVQSDE